MYTSIVNDRFFALFPCYLGTVTILINYLIPLLRIVMSVPSSSSNNISDNNKLGGASPSPIEGIEGVPGPSSLDPMHSVLPQDEESEEYGDDEDEDEDETSEGESEVSRSTSFSGGSRCFIYRPHCE